MSGHDAEPPFDLRSGLVVDIGRAGDQAAPGGRRIAILARAASSGGLVVHSFAQGTVHEAGDDLRAAIEARPEVLALWRALRPLGRNEFICWVEAAKQAATRRRRIVRTREELLDGRKRPCCWAGCIHREDKPPGAWQQAVLIGKEPKKAR